MDVPITPAIQKHHKPSNAFFPNCSYPNKQSCLNSALVSNSGVIPPLYSAPFSSNCFFASGASIISPESIPGCNSSSSTTVADDAKYSNTYIASTIRRQAVSLEKPKNRNENAPIQPQRTLSPFGPKPASGSSNPPLIPVMKSSEAKGLRLNKFVRRLHDMLQSEKDSGIVQWRRGLLILHSTDAFTRTILPKYFGTRRFKTFRRQLNYYGFVHARSFSATGQTTTSLWVNLELTKTGSDDISTVLTLKRVEACEDAKTVEGRRERKELALEAVEDDIGATPKSLQMEQIRSLAIQAEQAVRRQRGLFVTAPTSVPPPLSGGTVPNTNTNYFTSADDQQRFNQKCPSRSYSATPIIIPPPPPVVALNVQQKCATNFLPFPILSKSSVINSYNTHGASLHEPSKNDFETLENNAAITTNSSLTSQLHSNTLTQRPTSSVESDMSMQKPPFAIDLDRNSLVSQVVEEKTKSAAKMLLLLSKGNGVND